MSVLVSFLGSIVRCPGDERHHQRVGRGSGGAKLGDDGTILLSERGVTAKPIGSTVETPKVYEA